MGADGYATLKMIDDQSWTSYSMRSVREAIKVCTGVPPKQALRVLRCGAIAALVYECVQCRAEAFSAMHAYADRHGAYRASRMYDEFYDVVGISPADYHEFLDGKMRGEPTQLRDYLVENFHARLTVIAEAFGVSGGRSGHPMACPEIPI